MIFYELEKGNFGVAYSTFLISKCQFARSEILPLHPTHLCQYFVVEKQFARLVAANVGSQRTTLTFFSTVFEYYKGLLHTTTR